MLVLEIALGVALGLVLFSAGPLPILALVALPFMLAWRAIKYLLVVAAFGCVYMATLSDLPPGGAREWLVLAFFLGLGGAVWILRAYPRIGSWLWGKPIVIRH